MKTVKYTGKDNGPVITSDKFTKTYDFSTGQCDMEDADADFLINRCYHSYTVIDTPVTVKPVTMKPVTAKLVTTPIASKPIV